jgi:hypothetical protein
MPPEIRNLLSVPPFRLYFGGIGTQEINTRASIYRTGTRITVSGTNTNYRRMMGIFASGMNSSGWAFVRQENDMQMKAILKERLMNSLFLSVERN